MSQQLNTTWNRRLLAAIGWVIMNPIRIVGGTAAAATLGIMVGSLTIGEPLTWRVLFYMCLLMVSGLTLLNPVVERLTNNNRPFLRTRLSVSASRPKDVCRWGWLLRHTVSVELVDGGFTVAFELDGVKHTRSVYFMTTREPPVGCSFATDDHLANFHEVREETKPDGQKVVTVEVEIRNRLSFGERLWRAFKSELNISRLMLFVALATAVMSFGILAVLSKEPAEYAYNLRAAIWNGVFAVLAISPEILGALFKIVEGIGKWGAAHRAEFWGGLWALSWGSVAFITLSRIFEGEREWVKIFMPLAFALTGILLATAVLETLPGHKLVRRIGRALDRTITWILEQLDRFLKWTGGLEWRFVLQAGLACFFFGLTTVSVAFGMVVIETVPLLSSYFAIVALVVLSVGMLVIPTPPKVLKAKKAAKEAVEEEEERQAEIDHAEANFKALVQAFWLGRFALQEKKVDGEHTAKIFLPWRTANGTYFQVGFAVGVGDSPEAAERMAIRRARRTLYAVWWDWVGDQRIERLEDLIHHPLLFNAGLEVRELPWWDWQRFLLKEIDLINQMENEEDDIAAEPASNAATPPAPAPQAETEFEPPAANPANLKTDADNAPTGEGALS